MSNRLYGVPQSVEVVELKEEAFCLPLQTEKPQAIANAVQAAFQSLDAATAFRRDPSAYLAQYGLTADELDMEEPEIRMLNLLGNEKLQQAAATSDVDQFFMALAADGAVEVQCGPNGIGAYVEVLVAVSVVALAFPVVVVYGQDSTTDPTVRLAQALGGDAFAHEVGKRIVAVEKR